MVYFNAYCKLQFSASTYEVEKRIKELYPQYKAREQELRTDGK